MMQLILDINKLQDSEIKSKVDQRLQQFESFEKKNKEKWFSELCFCILTANSRAKTAIEIQKRMKNNGFYEKTFGQVRQCIKDCKHRFHNNKADYIVNAREHFDIKDKLKNLDELEARDWLVKNIKGLGYKEASHFLRNTGSKKVSILDRHILRLMHENNLIPEIPKTLTPKLYLKIEKEFIKLSKKVNMSLAELDMYMWYMKTGEVLK